MLTLRQHRQCNFTLQASGGAAARLGLAGLGRGFVGRYERQAASKAQSVNALRGGRAIGTNGAPTETTPNAHPSLRTLPPTQFSGRANSY